VAKKLGIIGSSNDGFYTKEIVEVCSLLHPAGHKIICMGASFNTCGCRVIGGLIRCVTGDTVVLYAGADADAVPVEIGPYVVIIKVKPDIPVKIAVIAVTRVSRVGAPHLL
jgi:hypothetical protein